MSRPKPLLLLILDGWGARAERADNAIALAHTPNWDALLASCPHTLVHTEGRHVGLPDGQMGNSEVGHMNIGAGRVVAQDLPRSAAHPFYVRLNQILDQHTTSTGMWKDSASASTPTVAGRACRLGGPFGCC